MVRNLINLKNIAIVAVFSLIAFVGFNSFINKEEAEAKLVQEAWYELTPTSDSDPAEQTINSEPLSIPPDETSATECAQLNNLGNYCAVLLDIENLTIDPEELEGKTVYEAVNTYGAEIITGSASLGYARQPQ